jgi:hypothetical protein
VQVSAVVRGLSYNDSVAGRNRVTGYGVQPTTTIAVTARDVIFAGAVWGHGVARYLNDLGGLGLDATLDADGDFVAIPVLGAYASLQHRFAVTFRGVATAGRLRVDPPSTMPGSTTERTAYYALSAIWSPRPTVDIGATAIYGEHRTADGTEGRAWRFQTALQLYIAK